MSQYGDSTALRNGRSSSEISIYDYPEHLNPFYEDENHKRLRFWKINKNKKNPNGPPSRRSSFSLGSLKDMWAFKSFRSKKSSTLGVNKTSESPPRTLTVDIRDTNYGTLDSKSRYSNGGLNPEFQRNALYRSSMQDMRSNAYQKSSSVSPSTLHRVPQVGRETTGFGRNEMYRATIQTPARMNRSSYNQNGGVMMRNSTNLQSRVVTASPKLQPSDRRSSQLSVASSTNPFDDDLNDENDKENLHSTWHGETNLIRNTTSTGSLTRPYRKKRRAPPPPVAISNVIEEETTKKDEKKTESLNGCVLHIAETSQEHRTTPAEAEISNITAQIESFVSQTAKDDQSPEKTVPPTPPERKYFMEKNISHDTNDSSSPAQAPKIIITEEENETVTTTLPSVIVINKVTTERIHDEPVLISKCEETTMTTEGIAEEPRKLICYKKVMHHEKLHSQCSSDTSGEITSRTNTKLPDDAIKYSEINSKTVNTENNSTVIEKCDTQTSPKKVKPPLSPKPNLTEIKIMNTGTQLTSPGDVRSKITEDRQNYNIESTQIDLHTDSKSTTIDTNFDYPNVPLHTLDLKITESMEDVHDEIANEIVELPYVSLEYSDSSTDKQLNTGLRNNDPSGEEEVVQLRETKLENNLTDYSRPRSHFSDEEPAHRRPVKYERKKSVREIIESINKNQSLLKMNNTTVQTSATTEEIKMNNFGEPELKDLDESQRDFKRLLSEIESYDCNKKQNKENYYTNTNTAEIDEIFHKIDELQQNGNMFKKCTATHHINGNDVISNSTKTQSFGPRTLSSREASPTASNLDWNPVPKPKRTKKLNNVLIMKSPPSPENYNERIIE